MAAPTYTGAGSGYFNNEVGGTRNYPDFTAVVGEAIIWQVLVDEVGDLAIAIAGSTTGVEALDGTASTMTTIGTTFDVNSNGWHKLWIGRATATTVSIDFTRGPAGHTTFYRAYRFQDVNTGTTLADVIENGTAGSTSNGVGTSTTISDTAVTTLGADRLACNFVAVSDDNAVAAFTSMTGGTWAEAVAEYASNQGDDATLQLQTATMASAGTIDGGSYTMAASDPWGVVGFALIGTTAAASYGPPFSQNIPVRMRL